MEQQGAEAEASPVTPGVLTLSERILAPIDAVFEFLVDPEKMLRWMGTEVRIDPRRGGEFWLNATGSDIAIGTYLEVDPPNRVVFTWGWEGSADVPPGSSTVTITLTEDQDITVVEITHAGLPGGAGDEHRDGWTYFLSRLRAVGEGRDPELADHNPNHQQESS